MSKYGNNNGNGGNGLNLPTAPGWLVTYGDIMSLLLTFFVLLISYSTIRQEQFRRALSSFQEALGILPNERSVIMFEDIPAVRSGPPIPAHEMIRRLRQSISSSGLESGVNVSEDKEGIRITFESPVLFNSGDADLRPDALPVLNELKNILVQTPRDVVVEGHTDNIPIHTDRFPSNWELSTERAISVAKYLFEQGNLNPEQFTVAGYAEFHPVDSNETAEGRQKNRRVEILLKNLVEDKKE